MTLTAAGRVFLDHARLALLQVEARNGRGPADGATAKARPLDGLSRRAGGDVAPQLAAHPPRGSPRCRRDAQHAIFARTRTGIDAGKAGHRFPSSEKDNEGVVFKILAKEPLIAVLPAEHRLASRKKIRPQDLAREIYVSSARTSPVLQEVIHNYASRVGITLKAKYEGENISSAMSLVASTGGISLVPLYAQNMLAPNVVARALEGGTPTVDLALGYNRTNPSPLLRRLLSRADELVANVQNQSIIRYVEAD